MKLNRFKTKTSTIQIIAIVLILFLSLFLYLIRTPGFPDDIPSSENPGEEKSNAKHQRTIFNNYTRYIRDNHGGLLIAEEKTPLLSEDGKKSSQFLHYYKTFDQSLVSYLTKKFSQEIQIPIRIVAIKKQGASTQTALRVDFLEGDQLWMTIAIESNEALSKRFEEPSIKSSPEIVPPIRSKIVENRGEVDPQKGEAKLAIIIDDLGYNKEALDKLVQLDYAITFSVLPRLTYTDLIVETIHQHGYEILLHMPMQPKDWPNIDPGPGALLVNDDASVILEKLRQNLDSVKYAVGGNNQMGSAFTESEQGLNVVMGMLKSDNLFFIDSKTAPGDTAQRAASRNGVPYLSRNIFLDNNQDVEKIAEQLGKAIRIAKSHGSAIAIGHPYPVTTQVLADQLPGVRRQGVEIVFASDLFGKKKR